MEDVWNGCAARELDEPRGRSPSRNRHSGRRPLAGRGGCGRPGPEAGPRSGPRRQPLPCAPPRWSWARNCCFLHRARHAQGPRVRPACFDAPAVLSSCSLARWKNAHRHSCAPPKVAAGLGDVCPRPLSACACTLAASGAAWPAPRRPPTPRCCCQMPEMLTVNGAGVLQIPNRAGCTMAGGRRRQQAAGQA